MEKLFLPYNLSLALKEIGFDEPCFTYYDTVKNEPLRNKEMELKHLSCDKHNRYYVSAPLYDQVIEWFIEKYGIFLIVEVANFMNDSAKRTWEYMIEGNTNFGFNGTFESRKEALNAGIEKAIELIKQKK